MEHLHPIPWYVLGIATYALIVHFRNETKRQRKGGEIVQILKLK